MKRKKWYHSNQDFAVSIISETFGQSYAVARKISKQTILIETTAPFPIGTFVSLQFTIPQAYSSVVLTGEVKKHYFLNFFSQGKPHSFTGMSIRFTESETNQQTLFTSPSKNPALFH